jgi:ATP-dependent DNA helicase RecG
VTIDDKLSELEGVGPARLGLLHKLNIRTISDLLETVPRKYIDFSDIKAINKLRPGQLSIKAKLSNLNTRYIRGGLTITEALASDETGSVRVVWFNQPYRSKNTDLSKIYYLSGVYQLQKSRWQLQNPFTEEVSDNPINTARILPIYQETAGLKSQQLRKIISKCLAQIRNIPEDLPEWVINNHELMTYFSCLQTLHQPKTASELASAKESLSFREVFRLSLAAHLNQQNTLTNAIPLKLDVVEIKKLIDSLKFELTDDQKIAIWQTLQDMSKKKSMNRLIQGDVGSGKTIVALIAAYQAFLCGQKTLFMAPTTILAKQHFSTAKLLLKKFVPNSAVLLLTSETIKDQRGKIEKLARSEKPILLIGTQSLIQESLIVKNLGLVIADEQHRFGVDQRSKLFSNNNTSPHYLSLSATPIPRTLALTLFGEVKFSHIKQMPIGRTPVNTEIISSTTRSEFYIKLAKMINENHKAYIVCPTIDSDSSLTGRKTTTNLEEELKKGPLKGLGIEHINGRLKSKTIESALDRFRKGKSKVLISTTVIEVGIDDPNATVMVIESPEAFGLAQLHQLRGRVGRGKKESFCYLISSEEPLTNRLRAMITTNDGFSLAEYDLKIRGPGAIYGKLQHGALDLKVTRLDNLAMIRSATKAAKEFIQKNEKLIQYPQLENKVKTYSQIKTIN